MIKKFTVAGVFALWASVSFAQDYDKIFELAEEALYREDFETALVNYEMLIESGLNYGNRIYYKAELCSLLTKYQSKPLDEFLKYEEEMTKEDKFYYYWKGRVLMRKYRMEEANQSFRRFLRTKAYLSPEIKQETRTWMKWVTNAKKFMDNPDSYEIHLLEADINSEYAELSPVYFVDNEELLFLSNRGADPNRFQIYHAIHEGERNWTSPTPLRELGVFTRDNANIEVVDEDGRLFQFRDEKGGDLYFSESVGDLKGWSYPQEFDSKVTSTKLGSHFFINEHEDRIIFASNTGSKKEPNLDLLESFKDPNTGDWSKPAPFTYVINSEFNEDSPYLTPDEQTLYFASDGHGSMGGYDIFMTTFDETSQTWSEPENVGFPLNSPEDELHFKMNPDQRSGYFTSNRLNTLGDFDIFFFWEISRIRMEGTVVDATTNEPVKDAQIIFRPYAYLDMYFASDIDDNGNYAANVNKDDVYKVEIMKDGIEIFEQDFEIHVKAGDVFKKDFILGEESKVEEKQIIAAAIRTDEPDRGVITEELELEELGTKFRRSNKVAVQHIYFDFGTSHLKDESLQSLQIIDRMMNEFPQLEIEIGGHTDNIGSIETNEWLSLERAKSIKQWLVDRGVSAARMIAKGYGATKPLATNDDEREGRELNRRIEIIVIE